MSGSVQNWVLGSSAILNTGGLSWQLTCRTGKHLYIHTYNTSLLSEIVQYVNISSLRASQSDYKYDIIKI